MSFLTKNTFKLLYSKLDVGLQIQQVRHEFPDWRMLKDHKRRSLIKQYGKERLRLNALRKNKILPPELQALADEEIAALPNSSSVISAVYRCAVTSRATGTVVPYRLSRIVFRHLADYNKLSGVQRARW